MVKFERTASIIPNPGVYTRPLTILNALVSGRLFCRPCSLLPPSHSPIICASPTLHIKHTDDTQSSNTERGNENNNGVIAQQRKRSSYAVAKRGKRMNDVKRKWAASAEEPRSAASLG